ncbi:MAG: alpha/beta fold hydrolase [bacterium]
MQRTRTMAESVSFASGVLRLEAGLDGPPDAARAAVICHPHPLYGGNMDNNVVEAIARACLAAGCLTLRFNFRGVGASDGGYGDFTGECDDARAALAFVGERVSGAPVVLAGYSFGALVALTVGASAPAVDRIVAVAPPLASAPLPAVGDKPVLIVAGDRDSYCSADALSRAGDALGVLGVTRTLRGGDHFLVGREDEIAALVEAFLGER